MLRRPIYRREEYTCREVHTVEPGYLAPGDLATLASSHHRHGLIINLAYLIHSYSLCLCRQALFAKAI